MAAHTAMAVLALWFAAVAAGAEPRWPEAAAAYDGGRYAEAAAIWERALREGADDAALWFNVGNARFRLGRLGAAVAAFRRAWRLAPRDPQILGNLRLAMEAGGASPPRRRWYEEMLERLSVDEARWLGQAGWWALWGLLTAARAVGASAAAPWLRRAAVVAACAAALGGAAVWHGRRLDAEHVVVAAGRSAQFAPLDTARAHFTLPLGSVVEVVEVRGEWRRIRLDGRDGWVRADALLPVADAASAEGGALRLRAEETSPEPAGRGAD
ncbi:MAG: tetratricopeptide repeat protein [Kiritimatiellae bacterium]|nr:tetratricopeptide repeat protein [Kiritimatiellia bacterium]